MLTYFRRNLDENDLIWCFSLPPNKKKTNSWIKSTLPPWNLTSHIPKMTPSFEAKAHPFFAIELFFQRALWGLIARATPSECGSSCSCSSWGHLGGNCRKLQNTNVACGDAVTGKDVWSCPMPTRMSTKKCRKQPPTSTRMQRRLPVHRQQPACKPRPLGRKLPQELHRLVETLLHPQDFTTVQTKLQPGLAPQGHHGNAVYVGIFFRADEWEVSSSNYLLFTLFPK